MLKDIRKYVFKNLHLYLPISCKAVAEITCDRCIYLGSKFVGNEWSGVE